MTAFIAIPEGTDQHHRSRSVRAEWAQCEIPFMHIGGRIEVSFEEGLLGLAF